MTAAGTRRSPSLRTRVAIAAALGATVVVMLLSVVAVVVIARDPIEQLDDRLLSVARLVAVTGTPVDRVGMVLTLRTGDVVRTTGGPELPATAAPSTALVGGVGYRVVSVGPATVGTPIAPTRERVVRRRRVILLLGAAAVAAAAGLGWLFGGRAVRPLRRLAERTHTLHPGQATMIAAPGARESEEIADALTGLLGRVERAQAGTRDALAAARDFAAAADHELRTPLTAMRTDLDVLREHPDLPGRAAVLDDIARTQDRLEATLTALGQLAAGDLTDPAGRAPVDLVELALAAAEDARRVHPGLEVTVRAPDSAVVSGWADGLRLALDNLVTNAVRHGHARQVCIRPIADGGLAVDDDGVGLPADERDAVLERFARGSTAAGPGSGLGLALVAQQARLHGGTLRLADSPTGGLRVTLTLPRTPEVLQDDG